MNSIEPIAFEIEGSDVDLQNYQSRLHPRGTEWDEVHDFILHEAVNERFQEFSRETLYEQFQDVISEELEEMNDHLPNLIERYRDIPRIHPFRGMIHPIYYQENITIVPNPQQRGFFYMMSDNTEHLRDVKGELIDKITEVANRYEAMGIQEVNIYHGSDFTLNILKNNENVNNVSVDDFDNDFEERIYRDLEPMSEAFVNNVTVSFDSPQEPEYDIILSLGPKNTLLIEVENHAGSDSQPSESDVIDDPSSEAGYINADCVFTIINGVDSELINQFRQKSELTDVRILEEAQCPDEIFDYIQNELLQSTLDIDSTRPI